MRIGSKVAVSITFLAIAVSSPAGSGPLQRVPNTSLAMPAAPPTFPGYAAIDAFGGLTFFDAVAIVTPPGETNRIFVVERGGRIAVITNLAAPTRTVFLDISAKVSTSGEGGLLSLAFHPGYATNGLFYVYYYGPDDTGTGTTAHDILARYEVSSTNADFADPGTEVKLIRQRDEASNHNGGDVHFGPDGYLYLSLGDEGSQNDFFNNSQRIDNDFFSGMLRIDVDKKFGSLPPNSHPASTTNYAIPPDNPFVGATNFNGGLVDSNSVRTEFWAVGFRNPFRWSFDPATGQIYMGDVGQNFYEEVNIIVKGGNYGWAYRDGFTDGPKSGSAPSGFATNAINPILVYNHGFGTNEGFAIIGGVVYRGTQLSQLTGAYIFGDNSRDHIWMLRYDGTNVSNWAKIASVDGPAGFGTDPRNGDVLIAARDVNGGSSINQPLKRLVYDGTATGTPLPATLSATGTFTNLSTLTPHAGIVPYDLKVPFWSDNAVKTRWVSVPNTNLTITFDPTNNYSFPSGTVWIKHFDLLTNTSPPLSTRVETRLLVRNSSGVYGVTYRWGGSTTEATLVPEGGMDETFIINNGGVTNSQVWRYPSWAECAACHTPVAGLALGFNTPQLNRDFNYSGTVTNQIKALSDAGYFSSNVTGLHTLPALADATNSGVSLEYRVRSYLAANCVQCHQPGGAALGLWDARIRTPGPQAGIIDGALVNDLGNTNNRVIEPGSISNSVIYQRVANPGPGHMPPLATSVVNTEAVQLLGAWITNDLPSHQSFADWQVARFGSTSAPNAQSGADPDSDRAANLLEYLTGTDPTNPASYWAVNLSASGGLVTVSFPQSANRGYEVQSSATLLNPNAWTPLDVPGNEPFFSISNRTAIIHDIFPGSPKFYRVRVFQP